MHKIVGLSFSYAENSMQHRGMSLLGKIIPFYKTYTLQDFNLPLVKTNKPNGESPDSVKRLVAALSEADAFVFGISEMIAYPCASFKNFCEWLVININDNDDLNKSYCISHKPLVTTTFSPGPHAGHRHWDVSNQLLYQLNCKVEKNYVFRNAWDNLLPDNLDYVKADALEMLDLLNKRYIDQGIIVHDRVRTMGKWLNQYEEWDKKWISSNQ